MDSSELIRVGTVLLGGTEKVIVTDVIITREGYGIKVWNEADGSWWLDTARTFAEWTIVGDDDEF